jgi:hypothetical protein
VDSRQSRDPIPDGSIRHLGTRVKPNYTKWGPGEVISLERAREIVPRDVRNAELGGRADRYVWVLHDDGRVGGWYPESLRNPR